jgi:hypothetical protein
MEVHCGPAAWRWEGINGEGESGKGEEGQRRKPWL